MYKFTFPLLICNLQAIKTLITRSGKSTPWLWVHGVWAQGEEDQNWENESNLIFGHQWLTNSSSVSSASWTWWLSPQSLLFFLPDGKETHIGRFKTVRFPGYWGCAKRSTSYLMLCHHRCKHVDQLRLQFTYQHLSLDMFISQCRQEASKLALTSRRVVADKKVAT